MNMKTSFVQKLLKNKIKNKAIIKSIIQGNSSYTKYLNNFSKNSYNFLKYKFYDLNE